VSSEKPRAAAAQGACGAQGAGARGARGARLGFARAPFVSGVGCPDQAVFGSEVLRGGDDGVLGAGWFDTRWALDPSGAAR
jgi:hypothetical protein